MRRTLTLLATAISALLLAGCGLLSPAEPVPPTPLPEIIGGVPEEVPPVDAEALSAEEETAAEMMAGTVSPGEVIFVRDGDIWALDVEGADERPLTELGGGAAIRDLTLSPDGRMLAFTLDSATLAVLDLAGGTLNVRERAAPNRIGAPVWLDSAALAYQKIVFDAETFAPTVSEVWQVAATGEEPPALLASVSLAGGTEITPRLALGAGRLLLVERSLDDPADSRLLVYQPGSDPLLLDFAGLLAPEVIGLSPDGSRLLLSEQAGAPTENPNAPVLLYSAALGADGTAGEPQPLVPADMVVSASLRYLSAQFSPDGTQIAALRAAGPFTSEVVLLAPAADGSFTASVLTPAEEVSYLALAWRGTASLVVQRLLPGADTSELWLLPLDGSEGRLLTAGEQPLVAGG